MYVRVSRGLPALLASQSTLVDCAMYFNPSSAAAVQCEVGKALARRWALYRLTHPRATFTTRPGAKYATLLLAFFCLPSSVLALKDLFQA